MNTVPSIKELVKDQIAQYLFYRDGHLWYEIIGEDFQFPVPIYDIGNATFNRQEKAMLMMRYIRKQRELVLAIRQQVEQEDADSIEA